jgi:mycothiol synthase
VQSINDAEFLGFFSLEHAHGCGRLTAVDEGSGRGSSQVRAVTVGFRWRRPAPSDLGAVGELLRARDVARGGVAEVTDDELAHDWATPGFALARDAWLAEDPAGTAVAYVDLLPDEPDGYLVEKVTAPGHGHLEPWLLALAAARGRELARGRGAVTLRAMVVDVETERAARYRRAGYRHVRTFFRMRLEPDAPIRERPWPDGVVPAAFDPVRHTAEVHGLLRAAFEDHAAVARPGPLEQWRHEVLAHPGFDAGCCVLVRAAGRLVGATIVLLEPEQGWVKALGVQREARGRGTAAAMLAEAFGRVRARGVLAVELGVDADSPTGATRLYTAAGMRVVRRNDIYERTVAAEIRSPS